jgi:uncharacterized protein (TIGR02391 family)
MADEKTGRGASMSAIAGSAVLNWKLIAIKLGDFLKYGGSVREVELAASGVFPFECTEEPNPTITSRIARTVYSWVMTLADKSMQEDEKLMLLQKFVLELAPNNNDARKIVGLEPIATELPNKRPEGWNLLHPLIQSVAGGRFDSGHFADAVEAALKEVNCRVKAEFKRKTGKELDGADLMHSAFSPKTPIILLDDLATESGRNIQQGYMELFAGSMIGIRNPKAHANISISSERGMHFLIVASLLMAKLDEARSIVANKQRPVYEAHNDSSARLWPSEKQCQCQKCCDYRAAKES